MNPYALVLLGSFAFPVVTFAGAEEDVRDIQQAMDTFHQAVVAHDGEGIVRLFVPEGSLWLNVLSDEAYSSLKSKAPPVSKVRKSSAQEFANFVSASKASLDPQHSHVKIQTDGTIGAAYFDFVFIIDGKAQNRGSETWQLVKGAEGWKIAAITYSSNPAP